MPEWSWYGAVGFGELEFGWRERVCCCGGGAGGGIGGEEVEEGSEVVTAALEGENVVGAVVDDYWSGG